MRKQLVAAAAAVALSFAADAAAQQSADSKGRTMEAVVIVVGVDPGSRTVVVETPKGQTVVAVPPEANLEQIQTGARYRVRYSEPVAVAIERGSQASAAAGGATATVKPRGSGAGRGEGVKMDTVSGTVEQVDAAGKQITLRTPTGRQAFRIGEGVAAESLKPGEPVTLTYQQAIATQMVSTPQPISDPAPAP
jgi:hypothetical protein